MNTKLKIKNIHLPRTTIEFAKAEMDRRITTEPKIKEAEVIREMLELGMVEYKKAWGLK